LHLSQALFLFLAALIAGTLNSVVGGGSFVSFPALLLVGMPPVNANATNTAALWPGTVASTGAYRRAFSGEVRRLLPPLVLAALIGGLLGARILLRTPQTTFMRLVPWLLLVATLLFVSSGRISAWVRARTAHHPSRRPLAAAAGVLFQLLIAVYIGYFGAGVGILLLALLALLGVDNIHAQNGMRTLLVSVANAAALVAFILAKAIFWPQALLMVLGASLGGYGGAYYAQRVPPQRIRRLVVLTGFAMSAYFFLRHWTATGPP
jgi:uncharacterized membrane protein YfcA